jgi:single-stranded-DNA-specific exonuclease
MRPTVMIALPPGGGEGVGSCRSIPAYDLLEGLRSCAALLNRFGGHRAAAGLQVAPERIDALREAFCADAAASLRPEDLVRVERADAVAGGEDMNLEQAEELARLGPFGQGNREVSLLLPSAVFSAPVGFGGEARSDHVRFTVASGSARAQAVAFGGGARLPVSADEPVEATFRLERNEWRGAVEPRLILRAAAPCRPAPIELVPRLDYLARASAEATAQDVAGERTVRDRRGLSVAGTIGALVASGERVLVVVADAERRLGALRERIGGFDLCAHADLETSPGLAREYRHVVVLDPPATAEDRSRCLAGVPSAYAHLAWGPAELRFAVHIHERDCELRAPLADLYRELRDRDGAAGVELEELLRGRAGHPRPPQTAGRLLTVLAELELIEWDMERRLVAVLPARPTELERSATFRATQSRLEDGRLFLQSRTAAQAA